MKLFFILIFLSFETYGGTCTTISRTNNAAGTELTSAKYNLDHNTAYAAINSADGGCLAVGTVEADALNTTDFAVLLNGMSEGCKVTASDSNTISIGSCRASVNGAFVRTTTATTATWGCTGCSSEVGSTSYYVYIKTGSSGSTLTPLISTTAPNSDGYDGSGNKVLAKFRNDGNSDIETTNIGQWVKNKISGFDSSVRVYDANNYGSTATKIMKWDSIAYIKGDAITFANSAVNGSSFTINEAGVYCAVFHERNVSGAATYIGISLNAASLTTALTAIADLETLASCYHGNGERCVAAWCGRLSSGDVVRPHTEGATSTAGYTSMTVTKVGEAQ